MEFMDTNRILFANDVKNNGIEEDLVPLIFYGSKIMENLKRITKKQIIISIIAILLIISIVSMCIIGLTINFKYYQSRQPKNEQFNSLTGKFTDVKVKDSNSAIAAAKDAADLLGLENAADELSVKSQNIVEDITYYRLQQNYQNIPVYGSEVIIAADRNGDTKGLWGNSKDISKTISMVPTVTQKQVETTIEDYFDGNAKIIVPEINDKQLVVYNLDDVNSPQLAYQLYVVVDGGVYNAILDAQDGHIYKMVSSIYSDSNNYAKDYEKNIFVYSSNNLLFSRGFSLHGSDGNVYLFTGDKKIDMNGKSVEIKIENSTYHIYRNGKLLATAEYPDDVSFVMFRGSEPIDVNDDFSLINYESKVFLEIITDTYDFFEKVFNRKGFDNNNGTTYVVYDCLYKRNDGTYYGKNAFSFSPFNNVTLLDFGNENSITYDLVAHEYMHSVEASESRMEYQGESGAIMEAYSDIFGELVEDWAKNQEEKLDGDCDWIHGERNLIDPNSVVSNTKNPNSSVCLVYPSVYKGNGYYTGTEDSGGVHHNSTVISHAAYLMTLTPKNNIGIGLTTAELAKLWYNTMLTLPSNCTFSVLRKNMEMTAEILGFSNEKIARISAAFDEVGIYNQSNDNIFEYSDKITVDVLTLFSGNLKPLSHYKIIVKGEEDSFLWYTKVFYKEINVTNSASAELKLKNGVYTIYVTDGNNVYAKTLMVRKGSPNHKLTFITDFAYAVELNTPGETDFEDFKNTVYDSIVVWENSDSFRSEDLTVTEIIDDYITLYMFCYYSTFFDSDTIIFKEQENDPLNRLWIGLKIDGDNIDWIIENVFNKKTDHTSSSKYHYYYGGDWYVESAQGIGDTGEILKSISEKHEQISGNKYKIVVEYICDNYHTGKEEKWKFTFEASFNHDNEMGNYWSIESFSKIRLK